MRIQQKEPFKTGYNAITELNGKHSDMMMDFGILKLEKGTQFEEECSLERAYLLICGEIEVSFEGKTVKARRESFLDDDLWCLNVAAGVKVKITGIAADSEVAVMRTENDRNFESAVRCGDAIVKEVRGKGFMNEAGTRIVRTAQDHRLTPESNLMLGEDVHYPGKWSGFPSHSHVQPEIYFYKFYPENGFGLLKLGDEGILLEHNDTVKIIPNKVHPQVTAPGYAMYYIWVIRHLDGNPYLGPDFQTACAYERVFGSEILALLRVYGLDDGRVCFYLEEQEGSPAAAIALQDRALWVSARPGTGVDGLTALARSIDGLLEVNGDLATAQALQPILGGEIDSSVYMVYQGEMPPADPAVHTGTREEVFDLLQRGHPYFRAHHADFAPWAEEMARKQELGLAELFVMEAEGQLVGTGSIGAEDDECGVITSVAVVPEFRRRGYGGRITSAVTRRILEKGKVPRMNAGYEAVARLYRSLGFVDCGRWGCLCLEGLPT